MRLHEEEERICRQLGDKNGLSVCLGSRADILAAHGDLYGAMALYEQQERIHQELGDRHGLASSLAKRALVLEQVASWRFFWLPLQV